MGLVLFFVSAYLLFGILRQREQRKVTPIVLTLAFVVIGSFCLTIAHIFGTLVGPGFSLLYEVNFEEDGGPREIKRTRQELEHANGIFAALAFCLSTSSIVVLPLTWVSYNSNHICK
jgi:ABC-type Fe3+-siderophore transport system permease subunit